MTDSGAKLLIVDDDASILASLSLELTETGYTVRSAEEGFAALREIRRQSPDIVLCDLNMPRMSGFEFLSVVRHRFPAIQAIAMSGSFCGNEVPSGVAADAFYEKGSSFLALLKIIDALPHLRRSTPTHADSYAPVWAHLIPRDSGNNPLITVPCPECLRTFFHTFDGVLCDTGEAVCTHCQNAVRFSILHPADCAPWPTFQLFPTQGTLNSTQAEHASSCESQ